MTATLDQVVSPDVDGATRWAVEVYPDYTAEVNASISFSGVDQSFFTVGKARRLLDLLGRLGKDAGRSDLLDIGCGIGLIHPHISGALGQITGVDVATDALDEAARANTSVLYRHYDGLRLPFPDASFDAVMTICVMHHVVPDQWADFIAEALRVLKPGGVFMVFEHNPYNPLTRLAVSRCAFDHDAVLLRPGQLVDLLRTGGFEHAAAEFMFFTPFASAPAQRLDTALKGLPLGAQYVAHGRKPG